MARRRLTIKQIRSLFTRFRPRHKSGKKKGQFLSFESYRRRLRRNERKRLEEDKPRETRMVRMARKARNELIERGVEPDEIHVFMVPDDPRKPTRRFRSLRTFRTFMEEDKYEEDRRRVMASFAFVVAETNRHGDIGRRRIRLN